MAKDALEKIQSQYVGQMMTNMIDELNYSLHTKFPKDPYIFEKEVTFESHFNKLVSTYFKVGEQMEVVILIRSPLLISKYTAITTSGNTLKGNDAT